MEMESLQRTLDVFEVNRIRFIYRLPNRFIFGWFRERQYVGFECIGGEISPAPSGSGAPLLILGI